MQIIEYITAGGLLSILGLVYKATRDNDAKVTRIYARLDEVKCNSDNKYTHQDVCSERHKQIMDKFDTWERVLNTIQSDIKILLRNGDK